jgi:tRNA pseudouridine38-40 synthase
MVDPQGAAPLAPLCRVRLDIAYDGGAFHGYAENVDVETVAGTLRAALERIVRIPLTLTGAGRTDAGVHAWGQVVSLDLPVETDLVRLQRSLNRLCGPRLVVRRAQWAADDFNARFSARSRRYRYTVLNAEVANPFRAATTWHIASPLDVAAMNLGAQAFLGEQDFSAFCKRPKSDLPVSLVRNIHSAQWSPQPGEEAVFEIQASAFCHNMVRSIVGTLVEVGLGKKPATAVRDIIHSRDRGQAGQVAPPHGLCLWEVGY